MLQLLMRFRNNGLWCEIGTNSRKGSVSNVCKTSWRVRLRHRQCTQPYLTSVTSLFPSCGYKPTQSVIHWQENQSNEETALSWKLAQYLCLFALKTVMGSSLWKFIPWRKRLLLIVYNIELTPPFARYAMYYVVSFPEDI